MYSPHPIAWFIGALCWIWLSGVAFGAKEKTFALLFVMAAGFLVLIGVASR